MTDPRVMRFRTADLAVSPLCLGGNAFGWTADRATSFAVLDAFADAGGNFIDTADVYSAWATGNVGGESERIIGEWLAARRNRDAIVVATKVGAEGGLGRANILSRVDASLARLGVEHLDLLYAHFDDQATDLSDTLAAFDELVKAGKVRYIAASNYSAERLTEALATSQREGLVRFVALQTSYNLVSRGGYEEGLRQVVEREGLDCLPHSGLASGFLTGKYGRADGERVDTKRGATEAEAYLTDNGLATLRVVEQVAAEHATTVAAVALAWLAVQPTVLTPLAGARSPQQLAEILPFSDLALSDEQLTALANIG